MNFVIVIDGCKYVTKWYSQLMLTDQLDNASTYSEDDFDELWEAETPEEYFAEYFNVEESLISIKPVKLIINK